MRGRPEKINFRLLRLPDFFFSSSKFSIVESRLAYRELTLQASTPISSLEFTGHRAVLSSCSICSVVIEICLIGTAIALEKSGSIQEKQVQSRLRKWATP